MNQILSARLVSMISVVTLIVSGCSSRTNNEPINFTSKNKNLGARQVPVKKLTTKEGSIECIDLVSIVKSNLSPTKKEHLLQINHSDVSWSATTVTDDALTKSLLNIVQANQLVRDSSVKINGAVYKSITFAATISNLHESSKDALNKFFNDILGFEIAEQQDCKEIKTVSGEAMSIIDSSSNYLIVHIHQKEGSHSETVLKFDVINSTDRGGILRIRRATSHSMNVCEEREVLSGIVYEEFLITPDTNQYDTFLFKPAFIKTLDALVDSSNLAEDNKETKPTGSSKITPNEQSKRNKLRMTTKSAGEVSTFPFEMWGNLEPEAGRSKMQFIDHCKDQK